MQFLDYYMKNLTLSVEKSDLLRYMVLHKFGGERRAKASWSTAAPCVHACAQAEQERWLAEQRVGAGRSSSWG